MARTELLATVNKIVSGNLQPAAGVSVLVQKRGSGTTIPVYASETGGTTVSNPLVTDADGRINGWVDSGSYNLTISGSGITTYTQPYESVRGDGVDLIAAAAVDTAQIKDGAVTPAKLASTISTTIVPTGTIVQYAGLTAPTGWVLANGATYDGTQATYTPMWNLFGTTYGGTGQASFKVPDLQARVPVGRNGTTYNLGDSGGSDTVTLTTAQLAPHTHTQQGSFSSATGIENSSLAHSHGIFAGAIVSAHSPIAFPVQASLNPSFTGYGENFTPSPSIGKVDATLDAGPFTHTHNFTIGINGPTASTGSGTAHENRQPFLVVNYLIKL
jgi:microcystin-dependent protein